jgi:hypothetical protein
MYRKICGCGYEKTTNKETWTRCPECGDNSNWEFLPVEKEKTLQAKNVLFTKEGHEKMIVTLPATKREPERYIVAVLGPRKMVKVYTDKGEAEHHLLIL